MTARVALVCGLCLGGAAAFGGPAALAGRPVLRAGRTGCMPAAAARRPPARALRVVAQETEDGEQPMQQYAINLEGHFKPNVGFMPHAFRVDGDFASGDPRFALKYDADAGGASTTVEVCGVGPTYEDFVAGFAPTSDSGWSVDPADGCLDIKDGDPDVLNVRCVCTAHAWSVRSGATTLTRARARQVLGAMRLAEIWHAGCRPPNRES
jgi:hypothetical protein